jgi:hypothetical protein
VIVAKGNNPRSYSLYTRINEVLHFSTGPGGAFVGTQSGKTFPLDEWVHVVAMVKEGKHIYYINGEFATEAGNGAVLPGLADTSTVFVARTAEGSREFLGMIDEVRIWHRALEEKDIVDQMKKGQKELLAVALANKLATCWCQIKAQ